MGFSSVRDYVDRIDEGAIHFASWRKTPTPTQTTTWVDLSMSPGNPPPNYYASEPLVGAVLSGTKGLPHGGNVSPATKHVKRIALLTATATPLPCSFVLCDYLLYYPFVDTGTLDPQTLDNAVTIPRYTDGEGVKLIAVITNSPAAPTGLTFTFDYTNQDGQAKTSPLNTMASYTNTTTLATASGTVATAGVPGPFLLLDPDDSGVRSVESFSMVSGTDVGLICLVLVRPLATFCLLETTAAVEKDFVIDCPSLPVVTDGAFLGLLANAVGNLNNVAIHGYLETVWN